MICMPSISPELKYRSEKKLSVNTVESNAPNSAGEYVETVETTVSSPPSNAAECDSEAHERSKSPLIMHDAAATARNDFIMLAPWFSPACKEYDTTFRAADLRLYGQVFLHWVYIDKTAESGV